MLNLSALVKPVIRRGKGRLKNYGGLNHGNCKKIRWILSIITFPDR